MTRACHGLVGGRVRTTQRHAGLHEANGDGEHASDDEETEHNAAIHKQDATLRVRQIVAAGA